MMEPLHNLWRRSREKEYDVTDYYILENTFKRSFDVLDFNTFVDAHTKEAALRVSPCVVSLISYSGEEKLFWASGIIIECDNVNGTFFSTVLTSASLLRLNSCNNTLLENLKVEVILPDGKLCLGDLINYDWHFNISAIQIQSSVLLPTANLRCLDDSIQTCDTSGSQLRQHSNLFKLLPGDGLIALGRYHSESYDLMVAPGKFSIDRCGLDCKELLRVNCKITKCGIGGPMINLYGEVVGINFYAEAFTPFLPMNVICKWWEHVKGGRKYNQPWLGMQVIRLFAAEMDELKKIVLKFPNISKGIFVEEVTLMSPAALAGICPNDVIVQFGGKDVQSCLELFEMTWDTVGKRVDLGVLRASTGAREDLPVVVGRAKKHQFNSWLLPKEYWRHVKYTFDIRLEAMDKTNVWRRDFASSFEIGEHQYEIQWDSFMRRFSELHCNKHLDIYVKRIAKKAAPSVVSIQIYSGGKEIFGSGFVIEFGTIITSATLLSMINTQSDDLKVVVGLSNGEKCNGVIEAYDFHYNLAAIKIQVNEPLEIASLKHLDDLIMIDPNNISIAKPFEMGPHSDLFRLVPGDRVIALGRYHDAYSDIMVSPGEFSVEQCRFDCKELLRSTGRITQCGIGGPLINRNAEVIGVNFFALDFTPFLPINIVSKWWNHFKKYRSYCRPWLGLELSNLFTVDVCIWEKIIQKFPNIKNGILVDEVTPNSSAGSVGIHPNDIIFECDGNAVKSCLQFFDVTWDKVGKHVELGLIRTSDGSRQKISMLVAHTIPSQSNRWPVRGHTKTHRSNVKLAERLTAAL